MNTRRIRETKISSDKHENNEDSNRGKKTRYDALLSEIIGKEGHVRHPDRIRTLPCHEIGKIATLYPEEHETGTRSYTQVPIDNQKLLQIIKRTFLITVMP